jgi:uronate dehydrogenase
MRVLLTGASGGVGARLRKLLRPLCTELILSDLKAPADLQPDEKFIAADLANLDEVKRAVEGIDGIVHLGGFSVEGPWKTILDANITGTYNLFEAAHQAGVKRIIFASSNHVVGFYPRTQTIDTRAEIRPDTRYGVSKAFGEALGAFYAYKFGIGVTCIRIGNVDEEPREERLLSIWLKPEDLVELIRIGLQRPNLVFEIVYGASDNKRTWWDNSHARELGYRPTGRSEDFAAKALEAQKKLPPNKIGDRLHGGRFASIEMEPED